MAPTKQQGPKEKFLKKVQSFSDNLYLSERKMFETEILKDKEMKVL
jgi:hypothetical protein